MDFLSVPVENIYYLLSYAWDKLEEVQKISVSQSDKEECSSLFAKVLSGGIRLLLKHGLDRGYVPRKEQLSRIRGKIDFTESLSINFLKMPRLVCEYDEFDYNILHNQILKTILRLLIRSENVAESIQDELRGLYRRLDGIQEISLVKRHFGLVKLNRNNRFYDFLMKICELIFDNLVPTEKEGKYQFKDFRRNHGQMAFLFESFVYHFYENEQDTFKVSREKIHWDISGEESEESKSVLPGMVTDITLQSKDRKVIVDTKYLSKTLQVHYDKETVKSSNLYQLFSYLINTESMSGTLNKNCEGILLYPVTDKEHHYEWTIRGHHLSVRTINLNQPWYNIHCDLLTIIGIPSCNTPTDSVDSSGL